MKQRIRVWLKWLLKLAFAAGLFWAVAAVVGLRDIGRTLLQADLRIVTLGWLIALAARWGEAVQLAAVMRHAKIPLASRQVFVASSLAALYGLVLPGDVLASVGKWTYLSEACGNRSGVLNAIVYNRLLTLTLYLTTGLIALCLYNPWEISHLPATAALLLGVFACLAAFYHPRLGKKLDRPLLAVSRRALPAWIHRRVEYVFLSLAAFRRFPLRFHLLICAAAGLVLALRCALLVTMAAAVGVRIPLAAFVWVLCALMLVRQLPLSFQGLGLREATLVVFLAQFGVASEAAFSLGLLCFSALLPFVVVGMICQIMLTFKLVRWRRDPVA